MNVLVLDLRLSVVDSVQRLEGDGFPVKACQRQMTRLSADLGFCSPSARPSSTCLLRNQSAVEYDKDNAENEGSYSRHMGDEMQRRKRILKKNIARKKKWKKQKHLPLCRLQVHIRITTHLTAGPRRMFLIDKYNR